MVLVVRETPNCCGINIVTGFGFSYSDGVNGYKRDGFFLHNIEKDLKRIEEQTRNSYGASILMVILNATQVKALGGLLDKRNWELIAENLYNKEHRSFINIYTKQLKFPRIR